MRVQQLGRRWALSKGALILMRMLMREVRHALRLRRGRARACVSGDVSAIILRAHLARGTAAAWRTATGACVSVPRPLSFPLPPFLYTPIGEIGGPAMHEKHAAQGAKGIKSVIGPDKKTKILYKDSQAAKGA